MAERIIRETPINRVTFEPMIQSLKAYGFYEQTVNFYQSWCDNLVDGNEAEYLFTMTIDYTNLMVYHEVRT